MLLELANARRALPILDQRRAKLEVAHIVLYGVIKAFAKEHTAANLVAVNGAWAHAQRVLTGCAPTEPTSPKAGAGERELDQKAA